MSEYFIDVTEVSGGSERVFRVPYGSGAIPLNTAIENVQTVYSASDTLTDAQIKGLPTDLTMVNLIPAPGEGKMVIVEKFIVTVNTLAGGYTNVDGDGCLLYIGYSDGVDTPHDIGLKETAAQSYPFIADGATEKLTGWFWPNTGGFEDGGVINDTDTYENKGVYLAATNAALGDLTGGNAANTLKYTISWIEAGV